MDVLEISGRDGMTAAIVPGRGAAIVSVRLPDGLELLAQGLREQYDDADYASGGLGGYDDCFPAIAAAPGIQDHGELWSRAWEIVDHTRDAILARCRAHGAVIERELRLTASELEVTVTITASEATTFLWAGHLLLAVDDSTTIELASPTVRGELSDASFVPAGDFPLERFWGSTTDGHRWADLRDGAHLKAFQPIGPEGASLLRGRHRIRIQTDQPWLGIWINKNSHPADDPVSHIGLEPCTSPHDALEAAVADATAITLDGGGSYGAHWTMHVEDLE